MRSAGADRKAPPVLVVGGTRRKAGKTSLAEAILHSFPEMRWTAVKISTHRHRKLVAGMKELASGPHTAAYRILEHTRRTLSTRSSAHPRDTGRFLAAGAVRSLLLEADETGIADGLAALFAAVQKGVKRQVTRPLAMRVSGTPRAIICETTRFAPLLNPDLFLIVIGKGKRAIKASSLEMLARADALVLRGARGATKSRGVRTAQDERLRRPKQKVFYFKAGERLPPALREFIRSRLFSRSA